MNTRASRILRDLLFRTLALLGSVIAIALIAGCRDCAMSSAFERCDAADSSAICAEVQKCFASGTLPQRCKDAEEEAIQLSQPSKEPADNGAARALTY